MTGESNQVVWRGVQPVEGISGIWPARNSDRVYDYDTQTGDGTTVIYEVGDGELLFINAAILNCRSDADGARWGALFTRDEEEALDCMIMNQLFDIKGQEFNSLSYMPAIEVPAGHEVCVESSTDGLDATGIIFGWLEDA